MVRPFGLTGVVVGVGTVVLEAVGFGDGVTVTIRSVVLVTVGAGVGVDVVSGLVVGVETLVPVVGCVSGVVSPHAATISATATHVAVQNNPLRMFTSAL
jgi:hypothetical protein